MTATIREQILTQIMTVLVGTAGVGTNIYRSRPEAVTRGEMPALLVEPTQDQAIQVTVPKLDWTLGVSIKVLVRGATPDQLADPIISSLHSKLMADQTLGGLCMNVQPVAVQYDISEADQPSGVMTCDYAVTYRTRETDLTAS